ncbi:MAG: ECF transporter S component [Desulfobacterales bacterium]
MNRPPFLFIPIGILLNLLGAVANSALKLPLFLDSIGTILAAVTLGPWIGAAAGFLSNLIIGIVHTPVAIPFGIVNVFIGLVAGYFAKTGGFEDYAISLTAGLVLGLLCPVISTPIAVYLFGGVTGGDIDTYVSLLMESGNRIFSSAFLVRIAANLADKLLSAFAVLIVIRQLPEKWKGMAIARKNPRCADTGRAEEK